MSFSNSATAPRIANVSLPALVDVSPPLLEAAEGDLFLLKPLDNAVKVRD